MKLSTAEKAQAINNDFGTPGPGGIVVPGNINFRGAIAEIGAGQEVARHFFEAYRSSNTLVKTMSAYGKGCSNAIYGTTSAPYISDHRLKTMLDYDYKLLLKRELAPDEKPDKQSLRYFTFANTVDIGRHQQGWAGVLIQEDKCSLTSSEHSAVEYRIHFELLTTDKATAIRIVGCLGINLIYAGILHGSTRVISDDTFISTLREGIDRLHYRIDSIAYNKFNVKRRSLSPSENNEVNIEVDISDVSDEKSRALSQQLCINLVKSSSVRCAIFNATPGPAIPSYTMIKDGEHLLMARSPCESESLLVERDMLKVATEKFREDLSLAMGADVEESQIKHAIHLPILSVQQPPHGYPSYPVYISRENEPKEDAERRLNLLQSISSEEVSIKIKRIVDANCFAFVSEFTSTSEMVKYLRTRTRLKRCVSTTRNIGLVLRADQFVGMLLNIKEKFRDREPLEIVGSLVRRLTRIYIYPCSASAVVSGTTLHGIKISSAFLEGSKFLKRRASIHARITIDKLKTNLKPSYASLIEYLEAADCIDDLDPQDNRFIGESLTEP